jgi:DNA-binding transcriptional regulator YhcF (GntR family)
MEFNGNKSIYLQICDAICEQILSGELRPDERIPSVREYGADIGVNPNTIMRSYEKLTNEGIIYNKRGIGYFISPDAREMVLEAQRMEFITDELPQIIRRAALLELDLISLLSHATPSESSPQS